MNTKAITGAANLDLNRSVKLVGGFICLTAVVVIFSCSAAINAYFLSGWGQTGIVLWGDLTITAFMYVLFGIGFDVLKAGLPFFASKKNWYLQPLIWIGWFILVLISLTSALGFLAETRGNVLTQRSIEDSKFRSIQTQIETDRKRLKAIGNYRDPSIIQIEIKQLMLTPIRGRQSLVEQTQNCQGPLASHYRICQRVAELRVELTKSQTAEKLRAQIRAAETKLGWLPMVPGLDVQALAISEMIGWTESTLRTTIIVIMAVAIEFFSCLGFWIVLGSRRNRNYVLPLSSSSPPLLVEARLQPIESEDSRLLPGGDGHISVFANDHLIKDPGSQLTGSNILELYKTWCRKHNIHPLGSNRVMPALRDCLNVKAKKNGKGRMVYPLSLRNTEHLIP